jgi:VIT1/CCC1 family predicted Fe2+/Mn2+ transporter
MNEKDGFSSFLVGFLLFVIITALPVYLLIKPLSLAIVINIIVAFMGIVYTRINKNLVEGIFLAIPMNLLAALLVYIIKKIF